MKSSIEQFRRLFLIYFILCNLIPGVWGLAIASDWTALVYVQARNNLSQFATKNFNDMATVGSNNYVTTLVQWYQPGQPGIWRYKIERGKMVLDECVPSQTDGNTSKDLADAMRWAVKKAPAQKYALILWDHGIGILDPLWGNHRPWNTKNRFEIDEDVVADNPRIQIEGLTVEHAQTSSIPAEDYLTTMVRGILFNEQSRTYMDNQNLSEALQDIKNNVLGGKKIDLLGMDACLMAMVEVSYLAHKYASVLVGSQEVELANGWDYAAFMRMFSGANVSAHTIAQGIVSSYAAYYKDKVQFYTQSAINLDAIPLLKENINQFAKLFKSCQSVDRSSINDVINKAHRSCQQFSTSSYVDLYSFYEEIHSQLSNGSFSKFQRTRLIDEMKTTLSQGMRLIGQVVIANTVGKNLARAHGISIYFPYGRVDCSYFKTDFARECSWLEFIRELANG